MAPTPAPSLLVVNAHHSADPPLDKPQLERFWDLETIGITDSPHSSDDDTAHALFQQSVSRDDGRYMVSWPWKPNHDLPDNYTLAKGRLTSLLRRLRREPDTLHAYDQVLQDQQTKGIIEKVPPVSGSHRRHYLPHHHVVSPGSATTKLRIVYDGSAKTDKSNNSLNDCLFRGPVLLQDLAGILLRFRMQRIAITADIEKAFLQISLHPADRDVTRFLWLKSVDDKSASPQLQEYRFTRVPLGVVSSPFLLAATVNHHLQTNQSVVADTIRRDLYVDNLLTGTQTVPTAVSLYQQAKSLFASARMNLRCWNSNSDMFRQTIPAADLDKRDIFKVLGLIWNRLNDTLAIPVPDRNQLLLAKTKREVLHGVAATYDPLGLFSPVTIRGKLLLQALWKAQREWDDQLDALHLKAWSDIVCDLSSLSSWTLLRYVGLPEDSETATHQLLCFSDASASAYAAAVYLRSTTQKGVSTSLVFSKNRLAPTRAITLPRLELMGVVLGIHCLAFVREHLRCLNLAPTDHLWTDSQCVIGWISSTKVLPVFIKNRVNKIRQHPAIVRYVSTADNPADLPSRGVDAATLANESIWWHGPDWLTQPEAEWPQWNVQPRPLSECSESTEQPTVIFETKLDALEPARQQHPLDVLPTRLSSLSRLLRVTAWIQRFLMRIRKPQRRQPASLTADEIASARLWWVHHIQHRHFADVLRCLTNKRQHSLIRQLGLFISPNGLLRCGGRFKHAELPHTAAHPMLLPSDHPFTALIIQDLHQTMQHVGTSHTLSQLRRQYRIPHGRQAVKKVLGRCLTCRRYHGPAFRMPRMPDLPPERVTRSPPFSYTGIDYFGPLYCTDQQGEGKVWVALFTCLTIRAVHLELATDLTADQFLQTLRRFIARRGTPKQILSDNAPHFHVTDEMLQSLWSTTVTCDTVQSYLADKGITWRYIPAHAPWMGGIYERLVGMVKSCLRKSLGRAHIRMTQLATLLTEIEAIINTRPLVYVGADDLFSLSPADLLQQHTSLGLPDAPNHLDDPDYTPPATRTSTAATLLDAWRKGQTLLNQFWTLWKTDNLAALREKQRATLPNRRPTVDQLPGIGDVVLIGDSTSRGCWQLGRIIRLHHSRDTAIRSAELQLPNKRTIHRPLSALYPLESAAHDTQLTSRPSANQPSPPPSPRRSRRAAAQIANQRLGDDSLY